MPWYSKEQPTPFDSTRIEGMQFLHGDVLARRYHQDWTAGQKYPLITFPSGVEREITTGSEDQNIPYIYLFDRVELPYLSSRDEALSQVIPVAQEHGYQLVREQDTGLRIIDPQTKRGYAIIFDNEAKQIVNIKAFPEYAMELMPGEIRAALPPLYSQENKGMEAIAPVKFFVPAGSWTWYATEFDGDDLLFGLVSGFEVELGYFSLRELDSVRDQLGLPIERDLYYSPTTLKEIQAYEHRLKD